MGRLLARILGLFRFPARILGLFLLAAGFVGLVIDATRSIVNGTVSFMPLGELAATLLPQVYSTIEPAVTRYAPAFLWDPVLLNLFQMPASVLGTVLGALLLWLGQKPEEPIGYAAGS